MTKSITPGVILLIRGKEVPLTADNFSGLADHGVSFSLTHPVDLGTVGDAANALSGFLDDTLGAGTSAKMPDLSTLPAPLNTITQKFTALDISIEQFDLNMPAIKKDASGTALPDAQQESRTYRVGLAAMWTTDPIVIPLIGIQVKGLFLQVSEDGKP